MAERGIRAESRGAAAPRAVALEAHWLASRSSRRSGTARTSRVALRRATFAGWLANRSSRGVGKRERRLAEREGFEPSVEFPLHTLSKRAQSTTLTSLRLESTICERSQTVYRKTLLQILQFCDVICIQRVTGRPQTNCRSNCVRPPNVFRSLTAFLVVVSRRSAHSGERACELVCVVAGQRQNVTVNARAD